MHRGMIIPAMAVLVFLCAHELRGQTPAAKPETKEEGKASAPRPVTAYRLDIAINELEDGKKINTRRYSINTTSDSNPQSLRIGTRVPVESETGKFTYLDVGTNINARIATWVTPMTVNVFAEVSSFATPEDATKVRGNPLLRQIRIEGTVPITTDKPIVVGTVDDPTSRRTFQLELTVAKLY